MTIEVRDYGREPLTGPQKALIAELCQWGMACESTAEAIAHATADLIAARVAPRGAAGVDTALDMLRQNVELNVALLRAGAVGRA